MYHYSRGDRVTFGRRQATHRRLYESYAARPYLYG